MAGNTPSALLQVEDANCFSMEYCPEGDLVDLIKNHPRVFDDEMLLKHLQLQLCQGLEAVHTEAGYAHLDIKPDNILLGQDYLLKLTDFGFANPLSKKVKKITGTDGYQAPETLTGEVYNTV